MARKLSTSRGSTGLAGSGFWGAAVSGNAPPNAKLTMTMLLVRRKPLLFISASLCLGDAQHRAKDSSVCAAPAEVPSHPLLYLVNGRVGRLIEQRSCAHDHSVRAV